MSQYDKAKIAEIVLQSGELLTDVTLETEAPRVPGFIALQSKQLRNSTVYVALTAIETITVKNEELMKTSPAYYFAPGQENLY